MKVYVKNSQKDLPIPAILIKKIAKEVILFEGLSCDEVSIYFVTTPVITKMHDQYFNDPTTTDCISFPMDLEDLEEYKILGEVFVCPATAIDYTKKNKGSPFEETVLYMVHALLHLMGYDDLDPKSKAIMRRAEKKHLTHLKKIGLMTV